MAPWPMPRPPARERSRAPGAPRRERPLSGGADLDARARRALAGDGDAFGELFRALAPEVERLCARLLGSPSEAEDATSEVFLRAQRSLGGYDPSRPFRTWLLAIASHHCVDRLRRRSTERRLFEEGDLDPEGLAGPGPSPLQHSLYAEARAGVVAALDALPDRYRAPLVLRFHAELDYDAIGEALGISRGQVATLLFRARRKLREALDGGSR